MKLMIVLFYVFPRDPGSKMRNKVFSHNSHKVFLVQLLYILGTVPLSKNFKKRIPLSAVF